MVDAGALLRHSIHFRITTDRWPVRRGVEALSDLDADFAVIGAGPAGAAAALALSAFGRVVILERSVVGEDRIGETLPEAARPLLESLGLWAEFIQGPHSRCRARRCVWGGPEPVEQEGDGS